MSETEGQGREAPAEGPLRRRLSELREVVETLMRVLRQRGPSQVQFWFIALALGVASGYATCLFRLGIDWLQGTLYGTDDTRMIHSFAAGLPWWWVLCLPILGGLAVGLILDRYAPGARVRAVADVIHGAALNRGRVEQRAGLASALASLITLSSGGSTGREGPVVHLAAVISSWVSERINANGVTGRDLMGCAVAAAVSARPRGDSMRHTLGSPWTRLMRMIRRTRPMPWWTR